MTAPWPMTPVLSAAPMAKSQLVSLATPDGPLILPPRFIVKVDWTGDCWLWIGANSGGNRPYGVTWDGQRRVKAHRYAYEAGGGVIPDGLTIDHLCKTELCVRHSHMEVVTKTVNVMRSDAPGPIAVRTNCCKRGHEFTPENTIIRGARWRECRQCAQIHAAASSARRSAARRARREAA